MPDAKILIIEDESITALAIKHKLERLGYSVLATESDGNRAIEKAQQLKPDLILMDIVLKGDMDGIEAADKIIQRFNIPIAYLTAYFDNETLEKAKLTRPYGYITKPFNDGDLKSTIETALYNPHIECKLKENEENLNAFLNAIIEPVFLIDLDGNIRHINKYTENILGNVVNANIYDISPPEKAEYRRKCVKKAIKTNEIVSFEDEGLGKFYEHRIYPISNENGNVSRLSIIGVNISDRKKTEDSLIKNEKRLSMTLKGANAALFDWHVPSGNVYFSSKFYKMFDYEPGEFPSTFESWKNLLHPEDREFTRLSLQKQIEEGLDYFKVEYRIIFKENEYTERI